MSHTPNLHLFCFCQKQFHHLLMTSINGKGVKALQMYRRNPVGLPSTAGADRAWGQMLYNTSAPVGLEVCQMPPTALGAHKNGSSANPPVAFFCLSVHHTSKQHSQEKLKPFSNYFNPSFHVCGVLLN